MHVTGSASATILPSPSLTFAEVMVGDEGETPMMTVARFEVTVELLPLIQGQVHVVSMTLDRPAVRVTANESGVLDWLERPATADAIEPDRFSLADVEIRNGSLAYSDSQAGVAFSFANVNASVDTPSLAGPWHIDGSYLDNGVAVPFRIATGRQLPDGSIRVKADFSPAGAPVGVSADGVLAVDATAGLSYTGTYSAAEVVDAAAKAAGETPAAEADAGNAGGRSEGSFLLSRTGLVIDKAVLSYGPADRETSLAGSLTVTFGRSPSFDAVFQSTQLDFDRTAGGGPNAPVNVSGGIGVLAEWLAALGKPPMPGSLKFSVPAIVAGGAVIQNVAFEASPADDGWRLKNFHALLPGDASLTADGTFTTTKGVGFVGDLRLSVGGPSAFAAWWRGRAAGGGGQALSAFDIGGKATIAPGLVSIEDVDARIGDARFSGSLAWSAKGETQRKLGAQLSADRIDLAQVKALADLLVGRDLTDVRALADSYEVVLDAGSFQYQDVLLKGVKIDARYSDDILNVVSFSIDDLGGASFKVTSGRIEGLTTEHPQGRLDAKLEAHDFDGLAAIAAKVAPGTGLFEWIGRTAPALAPTVLNAKVIAPPPDGTGIRVELDGVAGQSTVGFTIQTSKDIANWRSAETTFHARIQSPDSAALALQLGFAAVAPANDPGGEIAIDGSGVAASGLDTTIDAAFAGLDVTSTGKLAVDAANKVAFEGTFGLTAENLDTFIATVGLTVPGAAIGTKFDFGGHVAFADGVAAFDWRNGTAGERAVSGKLTVARNGGPGWQVGGDLAVDTLDLDWLMSLGLGFAPIPTGDPAAPWSKTPFGPPTYGGLSGKIAVAADHFLVGENLDVANAAVAIDLKPHSIDAVLSGGQLAGGAVDGSVSVANVDGDANVRASFALHGAALQSFVWQRDSRAVATGLLDLSGSFEATGRSPAALVSSATGGGVIEVRDSEVRYTNPNTARLIVRASDLGQEYSDPELEKTLADNIDADSLRFDTAGAPFSIAAGAVRIKDMALRSDGVEASGDTVIDLNTMAIDSDWTLKFDPGDSKVQGTDPKVGLIFRGPLDAPTRRIDALPFSSYLNSRRAARMLEIIATEEADRAERERLTRLVDKLNQDRDRVARIAAAALERERLRAEIAAAAAKKIFDLHVSAEADADKRTADALQRAVDRAVAAVAAGEKAADEAAARVVTARESLVAAEERLAAATKASEEARAAVTAGASALATAQAASEAATAKAAGDIKLADEAEKTALDLRSTESSAVETLTTAHSDTEKAERALVAAAAVADAAIATAEKAKAAAEAAQADLLKADAALQEARDAAARADDAAKAAEAALAMTNAAVRKAAIEQIATATAATEAAKARDARKADMDKAAEAARTAAADREAALQAMTLAEQESDRYKAAYASAQKIADDAAAALETNPMPDADKDDPNGAGALADLAKRRAMTLKAHADAALQNVANTRRAYESAEAAASAATARATEAEAALAAAASRVDETAAAARKAAAEATAGSALQDAAAARDAAVERAEALAAAAEAAAAAFSDAQTRADDADARAAEARKAATEADNTRSDAARRLAAAVSAENAAAFARTSASDAAVPAMIEAVRVRTIADESNAKAVAAAAALETLRAGVDAATDSVEAAAAARAAAEKELADAEASVAEAEAASARAEEALKGFATDAVDAKQRAGIAIPDDVDQAGGTKTGAADPVTPPKPRLPAKVARDKPIIITPPY